MSLGLEILKEKHRVMFQNYTCVVSDDDYDLIKRENLLLEKMSEFENRTFTLCDLNCKNYLVTNNRFKQLLSYKTSVTPENNDMEYFYDLVHPNDLPFVLETEMMALELLHGLPRDEKYKIKLVYDFRMRTLQGVYRRFINQIWVYELDQQGNVWLIVVISDLLSDNDTDILPKRFMIDVETHKFILFNEDKNLHSYQLLTTREREIIFLVSQGWESEKIASKLFISVNTVHNHRQHIILKTNCENLTQAALYAKNLGII